MVTPTLHYHPLSSYCQKVLTALYENNTPFKPYLVDLGDQNARAEFLKLWPVGKFPVLRDDVRERTIPESSIIIEYLGQHYPGRTQFIPADPELARETRLRDRFFDFYVHDPMQRIVGDRLRPADSKDPFGVNEAKARLQRSYEMLDRDMAERTWATGENFTLADCAAAPALYYANLVKPFDAYPHVTAYFARLMARPSFARAVKEAGPYRHMFPAA